MIRPSLGTAATLPASGVPQAAPAVSVVEGELLVKFRGGSRGAAATAARQVFRHEVKRHFDSTGWQHIRLPAGETVAGALTRFRRHPGVLAVEPNYQLQAVPMSASTGTGVTPNDPQFTNQWALLRIGATNAWATTTGSSNVVVAVIDSGVRYNHEDLAANMWRNPGESGGGRETNGIDDDGNGYVDDVHGIDVVTPDGDPIDGWLSVFPHGTMATGPVGAVGNNGRGVTGVNWSVQVMAMRFLSQSGNVTSSMFVETCNYILAQKQRGVNIRATSSSWGFRTNFPGQAVRDAIERLGQAGILNVFAAGEERIDLDGPVKFYPQSWHVPGMINVAASDRQDQFATNISNWGLTNVDLAAPGVDIVTTYGVSTNDYIQASGTSFSCPYVAGAIALIAAAHPHANAGQIQTALMLSVDVLDTLTNRVTSKGRLNVGRAITHPGLATNAPPFLLVQPRSGTVGVGESVAMEVTASGPTSPPLTFQWQRNGANLNDATNARLALTNVSVGHAGDYQVIVSNAFGSVTSAVARLGVLDCPVIFAEPSSRRIADGTEVTLNVTSAGAVPLSFQWQRNGTVIPGAASSALTLSNVATNDSGDYRVIVSNGCGSVTSAVAAVTVLVRPRILAHPQSQTVAVGDPVTFGVTVSNNATLPLTFRWRRNAALSAPVTTNQFTVITNLPLGRTNLAGIWQAVVTNEAASVTSSNAYLTFVIPPTNQTVPAGTNVSFNATAIGPAPIRYQWQHEGTNLPGATGPDLLLTNVQGADAGTYSVVVINAIGQATPFTANLDVLPRLARPRRLSDGTFQAALVGFVNQRYTVEVSTNLVTWSVWQTVTATTAEIVLTDPTVTQAPQRFYRARAEP